MRFEVFMAVKIQDKVFWVVTLCNVAVGYKCEDGGSKSLQNSGILLQKYKASQLRRP
jgi:hypothetical protein